MKIFQKIQNKLLGWGFRWDVISEDQAATELLRREVTIEFDPRFVDPVGYNNEDSIAHPINAHWLPEHYIH